MVTRAPFAELFPPESEARNDAARRAALALRAARSTPVTEGLLAELRTALDEIDANRDTGASFRHITYGISRLEAEPIFAEVDTDGNLHAVYAIAGHQIMNVITYEVGDNIVFPSQIDADGNVTTGRLAGLARLRLSKGAPGQEADPVLVAETTLDSTARGTDTAYIYARYIFDADVFSSGVPSLVVVPMGKPVVDPRDGLMKWSNNPALAIYDALIRPDEEGGLAVPLELIDVDSFKEIADLAEETVATKRFTAVVTNTVPATSALLMSEAINPFQWCDQVQVNLQDGEVLPSGLSIGSTYYVIIRHDRANDVTLPAVALALTFDDAVNNIAVAIGPAATTFGLTKVAEPRYTIGATFRTNDSRSAVVTELVRSMAGSLLFSRGLLRLLGGQYTEPVAKINLDNVIGAINLDTRRPRSERFNHINGDYTSPGNLYRSAPYPIVNGGGVFQGDDGGEITFATLDLPFVQRPQQAQRLAKLELFKARQEVRATMPFDLRVYNVRAGENIELTVTELGWSDKLFEVTSRQLFLSSLDNRPFFGIEMSLRATDPIVYDFDADEEVVSSTARLTSLSSIRTVAPPGVPSVSESLFQTSVGAGLRVKVRLDWQAAPEPFFAHYHVRYRLSSETDWILLPDIETNFAEILDIAANTYDFEVATVNTIGVQSEVRQLLGVRILGLSAPPETPTNLSGQIVGNSTILQWDRHPALDVSHGGTIEVRHHTDCLGGRAEDAVLLATVTGDLTIVQVPAKRGCYYVRAIDQTGQASGFAEWGTDFLGPVVFAQLISGGAFSANDSDETKITIQEDPTFPSTNVNNTLLEDVGLQVLKLAPDNTWDDAADVDAIADVDLFAADPGAISAEGVYYFSSGVALTDLTRMRVETLIETLAVNTADSFDERPGLVDDYADFDGTPEVGAIDAWIEARFTRDDPLASPTWTPWQRIDTINLFHRGVEFRLQVRSNNPSYNCHVSQLRVLIREITSAD